ncbi:MAG TPA: DNA topoisomerase 3 [Labilithrix sp.]|nr:DNA topoisomerase 3 [Labilithrix sp.]
MTVLVVAEKPSVARDIAAVLGARTRGDGFFSGEGWVVTWAIGHLVALAEPHEMNPSWKRWTFHDLPLLPPSWPLVVSEGTRAQFEVVRRWLLAPEVRGVVCATDAGREGELIFRYIYEAARSKKPVRRLWISSLTADAIRHGFKTLQEGKAFDRLADAARARSRADWLVGMNLSRMYSLLNDDNLSVGRVQTPTLAMLVTRELEIRAFVPEDYLEVVATFGAPEGEPSPYQGTWFRPGPKDKATRLPPDGKEAEAIVQRAKRGLARVESVDRQSRKVPPPELYDLTELQRHANRLFGYTAQRTLEIAQKLYERRKLLSYPRTDSRHISRTVESTLPAIVQAIEAPYRALLAEGTGKRPLGPRFVDDARVSDHHAILPTETKPPEDLSPEERAIYDLVCRRLLSAWHADHVYAVTNVVTAIAWNDQKDRFASQGTSIENAGWKVLELSRTTTEVTLPGGLAQGLPRRVLDAKPMPRKTKPPPRLTDGTLLTAMENAGRTLDEKELSKAMRECGLGTPATRAAILETLLRRDYVIRDGKLLQATDKGVSLIGMVHEHVKSPAMTGEWEAKLARIERGEGQLATFMADIERYVREVVGNAGSPPPSRASGPPTRASGPPSSGVLAAAGSAVTATPAPAVRTARSSDLEVLLKDSFGFGSFRPYQEDVCRAAAQGSDVLLVMPTGAGKSLCYQLPGVARGGTTLVVSPLIALMEDQVGALQRRGFAAERIHSGRDRAQSRAACKAYLDGALDFLFIAPERLKVAGFPEMLARRKPTLIAVDEAHCISQWGHDFRPEYRMLGERLPMLRPAPIIALTATATPRVQDDIARELRLENPSRFIHGFRRTNIAVEVVERNPGERAEVVQRLLADPAQRPAIVYAPTRKEAEQLAKTLSRRLRAAAYHAGLGTDVRDDVQSAFLESRLDVIVATTAFGMGIDKADVRTVIHTALPATLEGYYQEIGRAGRDGAPSRAVLLHSFVDSKTHEFFFERDYPAEAVIAKVQKAIPASGIPLAQLSAKARVSADAFEKAFEKLWVHGGAVVADDTVKRGTADWATAYAKQRAHKREQLVRMRRYGETSSCRMLQLVAHFGDQNDAGAPCGLCDVCAPSTCVAQIFRAPSAGEQAARTRILDALRDHDGRSVGQLQRDVFEGSLERRALDHILGALARAGEVRIVADEFVKDGETIAFQRVHLARMGTTPPAPLRMVVMPEPSKAKAKATRGRPWRPKKSTKAPTRRKRTARARPPR